MIKLFDTKIKDDNSPCPFNSGDFILFSEIDDKPNTSRYGDEDFLPIAYIEDVVYEENENEPYDDATIYFLYPTNLNPGNSRKKPGMQTIQFKRITKWENSSQGDFSSERDRFMRIYQGVNREHLNRLKRESARRIQENESGDEMIERKQRKSEYDKEHQRYSSLKRMINRREKKGENIDDLQKMLNREIKKTGIQPKK